MCGRIDVQGSTGMRINVCGVIRGVHALVAGIVWQTLLRRRLARALGRCRERPPAAGRTPPLIIMLRREFCSRGIGWLGWLRRLRMGCGKLPFLGPLLQ